MTMAASRVFIDTNVLVYAAIPQSPFCLKARGVLARLERAGHELCISRQVIRELLVQLSRTPHQEYKPADIFAAVRTLEKHYWVAEEHSLVGEQLYLLLDKVPCGGKQIHDANIVATMLAFDIPQLFTYNLDDFRRFDSFIRVSDTF